MGKVTVTNCRIYSMSSEMAYQITYSDGTEVRAVVSPKQYIRCEYLKNGVWVQSGKPYIVKSTKTRNAETIKLTCEKFLSK